MSSNRTMKTRAKRGAVKLDSYQKNWFKKICLEDLHINDDNNCILGQLFAGDCQKGLAKLGLKDTQATANGFMNDEWNDTGLEDCWKAEIESRLPKKSKVKATPAEAEPKGSKPNKPPSKAK